MKPHNHTDYQKRFFKEVKKQFPFYGKREKEYLKQFQTEIDAYLEEFPDSSYEAMLEAIGTPKRCCRKLTFRMLKTAINYLI
mgnify:CR=1 FL=1